MLMTAVPYSCTTPVALDNARGHHKDLAENEAISGYVMAPQAKELTGFAPSSLVSTWHSPCDTVVVRDNCYWNILVTVAEQCENRGHYETAEGVWFKALDTVSDFSLKDPRVLHTIGKLGNLLFRAGELERAQSFFVEHARLTSTIFGAAHVKTAESLSRLGMVFYAQKSYAAAELCFLHALGVHLGESGEACEAVMRERLNLAHVLAARENIAGAQRQLKRALNTSQFLHGVESSQSLSIAARLQAIAD